MGTLNLWTNDALGTGPLCVGVGAGSDMNNDCSVGVSHDRALNTNTFVELKTTSSRLRLKTASPRLGSVEGNGFIILGDTSLSTTATLGLDNRDAEYFGQIEQRVSGYPCRFVKDGSGTWTLWNLVTLSGGVTVSNGTLRVNNWVNTLAPVTVYPGATLDGIGRVGIVSNLGGTVKGRLVMQQLSMGSNSVLQVALNGPGAGQYDVVTVNGPLNLTGGALALTLGFKPTPGQTFTILNNAGGTISGQFASGQTVSGTYNGQAYGFRVTYDSGNNIVLTALSRGTVIGLY
jgi:autotransporter-associated beta strand protein